MWFPSAWCNFIFHQFEQQLYFLIKPELRIKLESILKCTRMKLHKHSRPNEIARERTALRVTTDAARLSPHSNFFHDRPDVIKWHVAGDGCQEETQPFIRLHFGGYQAFWSAGSTPIRPRGSKAQTLQQQPFYCVTDSDSTYTVGINVINVFTGGIKRRKMH